MAGCMRFVISTKPLETTLTQRQIYHVATIARRKLGDAADEPDHNLRVLVGHANFLDGMSSIRATCRCSLFEVALTETLRNGKATQKDRNAHRCRIISALDDGSSDESDCIDESSDECDDEDREWEHDELRGENSRNHFIDDTDRHDVELSLRRTVSKVVTANEHTVDAALTVESLERIGPQPALASIDGGDSDAPDDDRVCRPDPSEWNSAINLTNLLQRQNLQHMVEDTTSRLSDRMSTFRSPLVMPAAG